MMGPGWVDHCEDCGFASSEVGRVGGGTGSDLGSVSLS